MLGHLLCDRIEHVEPDLDGLRLRLALGARENREIGRRDPALPHPGDVDLVVGLSLTQIPPIAHHPARRVTVGVENHSAFYQRGIGIYGFRLFQSRPGAA